jgi:hypothetical protein
MTVDCRLAGILAGETARRVASKTHWRLILPTSYPSSRSDWPIHIDSRRRSNVSNAQIAAVGRPRAKLVKTPEAAIQDRPDERGGSARKRA